ncbi:DUF3492 domain-containing protein [Streptomyces sp. YIM S03343]
MRIGLLTEGGYPYVGGDARFWCDRLVRGLGQHDFDVYALSRTERQHDEGWVPLPPQVARVRTAPLWAPAAGRVPSGRRARRRLAECCAELAAALCGGDDEADRFGGALYGLAELARDEGGLGGALRSEDAVRALERACRAPGAVRAAHEARVPDLLTVASHVERALRPLSLDWYGDDALGAADLCHAASGGTAALPGLLARHFCGVPLLITEYGVPLRAHHLAARDRPPAVRALLAALHGRLAAEVYRGAALVTHATAHTRRWQERCGADRARLRTVHPGMDAAPFAQVGEARGGADQDTLVWTGRIEPAKDLVTLLHAFAAVRTQILSARLRIVGAPSGPEGHAYLEHCRELAERILPAAPVTFEETGGAGVPADPAEVYASGSVAVFSSAVEGFPTGLVEAMFCGRATVSTDVGAVVEAVGGTGLVVPPSDPGALAEACVALLRDPERRERLGAAARTRALELFTVERNIAAFHALYLEIVSRCPVRRVVLGDTGEPLPFAVPAEAHVPGRWTRLTARTMTPGGPGRSPGAPVRATGTPLAMTEGAR